MDVREVAFRKASPGKYRLVGVDTFSGEDFLMTEEDTLKKAKQTAELNAGGMFRVYVYDDQGKCAFFAGTY